MKLFWPTVASSLSLKKKKGSWGAPRIRHAARSWHTHTVATKRERVVHRVVLQARLSKQKRESVFGGGVITTLRRAAAGKGGVGGAKDVVEGAQVCVCVSRPALSPAVYGPDPDSHFHGGHGASRPPAWSAPLACPPSQGLPLSPGRQEGRRKEKKETVASSGRGGSHHEAAAAPPLGLLDRRGTGRDECRAGTRAAAASCRSPGVCTHTRRALVRVPRRDKALPNAVAQPELSAGPDD